MPQLSRFPTLLTMLMITALFLASRSDSRADGPSPKPAYAVVVSKAPHDDPGWAKVVKALQKKHDAEVVVFDNDVNESLASLRELFPRYVCFLAAPTEAGRKFVSAVHRLTRKLDDDPYTDVFWGILTGYDAANALRIAETTVPLVVHRVAGGTSLDLNLCDEGVWYSEGTKNLMQRKESGGQPTKLKAPDDTTKALVDALCKFKAQMFITSGHATERDWQIGYSYRNGSFRCKNGRLFGLDTKGKIFPVRSDNPKIYLPAGNCLMGHIDGKDAMALAFMNTAGVRQMIGYTVPSWYGYSGWGCLDMFYQQPGRYSLTEAMFANHQSLLHKLESCKAGLAVADFKFDLKKGRLDLPPEFTFSQRDLEACGLTQKDVVGMLYDRDTLAFYGDPAWEARMAAKPLDWEQTLIEKDGTYTFEIKPNAGGKPFAAPAANGVRGGRPAVHWLPRRIKNVAVLEGNDLHPLITDDFILVPRPEQSDQRTSYRVVFKAQPIDR